MLTEHLRKFTQNSCVPLGTGEDIYLAENFEPVLGAGINLVHPDTLTIGGLGEIKKLGVLCEKYGAAIALHMAESPDRIHGGTSCSCGAQKCSCC